MHYFKNNMYLLPQVREHKYYIMMLQKMFSSGSRLLNRKYVLFLGESIGRMYRQSRKNDSAE